MPNRRIGKTVVLPEPDGYTIAYADRCARVSSGQDAASPPMRLMNSRRLIRSPRRRGRAAGLGR
jgi:hypothetical protein